MVLTLSLQMVLVTSLVSVYSDEPPPTVTTCQGRIEGYIINTTYGCMNAFQGIPYAKPPVCGLRFKAPVPAEGWNGTLRAVNECSVCAQTNFDTNEFSGDENCLCINVYTPKLPDSCNLLPVMVWIHGGGYYVGSGNLEDQGPAFLLKKEIIYVSFNYRLSILGFACTEDEVVPGNMGMKDQVLALRWVKKNIAAFGGDPDQVTIFGGSAGGASVSFHILSPMSAGLFHAAIAQSGSSCNGWSFRPRTAARNTAFYLGKVLGYTGNCSQELVDFLRAISAEELCQAAIKYLPESDAYRILTVTFVPVVEPAVEGEESFLPHSPALLLAQGKFNHVSLLTGITSGESLMFLAGSGLLNGTVPAEVIDRNFSLIYKPELRCCRTDPCGDEMIARIKKFYFGDDPVRKETLQNLIDMSGDMFFTEGIIYAADKLSSLGTKPVYLYEFSYEGGFSTKSNYSGASNYPGVVHGDELPYIFDNGVEAADGSTDALVRQEMVDMWTNFAKTGNPTPSCADNLTTWLPYSTSETNYLDIGAQLTPKTYFRKASMDFWRELYGSTKISCTAKT